MRPSHTRLCRWWCLILTVLTVPAPALAHDDAAWYNSKWKSDHHTGLSITWRFAPSMTDSAMKARITEAFGHWNVVGYSNLSFNKLSDSTSFQDFDPCAAAYNGVSYAGIDGEGDTIARTLVCQHSASPFLTLHQFVVRLDDKEPWYTGDGAPPGDKLDVEGVATHEVGHVTGGWLAPPGPDHFTNSTLCSTPIHTMCGGIGKGDDRNETLEFHDKDTFQDAY